MTPTDEQALRTEVSVLALDWATTRTPPFTGETADDFRFVIEAAHVVADEAALGLRRWVDAGRRAGLSWTDIGEPLGVSKQAAQQRFRSVSEPIEGGEHIVKVGVNAFNEMQVLEKEGRARYELLSVGLLTLAFQPTDKQWEYCRVMGLAHIVRPQMEREGWTLVSSWFPFQYFKRTMTTQ